MRRRRMRSRTNEPRRSAARIADQHCAAGRAMSRMRMGITLKDTGLDLLGSKLYIEDRGHRVDEVSWSPRIGISVGTERYWRCYAAGHASVSGKGPQMGGRSVFALKDGIFSVT